MDDDPPEKCKIWGTLSTYIRSSGNSIVLNSSRAGGKYKITNSAIVEVKNLNVHEKVGLTSWLVEQRKNGIDCPVVDSYVLPIATNSRKLSVTERVDRLLFWLADSVPSLGKNLPVGKHIQGYADQGSLTENMNLLCAHIGSQDTHETMEVVDFAVKSNFVDAGQYKRFEGGFLSLTFEGHQRVEQLRNQGIDSSQGFVAMWFAPEMDEVFDKAIKPAIEDAGYQAMAINRKEHNNQIVDEIISEIRRSKFVVADFTCGKVATAGIDSGGDILREAIPRGGVYFEAGFAKGLGREVIWTVRKDCLANVHFDNAQYNFIVWDNLDDLRQRLSFRISATLDYGPFKLIA